MSGQILLHINKAGYGENSLFTPLKAIFEPGQCAVLVGPGGSGKTTLLKLINDEKLPGTQFWYEGIIDNPYDSGFLLPQHFSDELSFYMTDVEKQNLQNRFGISQHVDCQIERYNGVCYREIPRPVRKLLFLQKFLCGDQYSRVSFLLLDEPEAGLDALLMDELIALINDIKNEKIVIISSHHVAFTRAVADQVLYIKYGNMIYQDKTEEFFNAQNEDVQYLINMGC